MRTSVALCTYNGEKFIGEQLDSILRQTVCVDEIVVCDDGSTDNTLDIVESILSKSGVFYRIEKNEKSLGVSNNFLKALKLTTGDYVFTCDQDDLWYDNKVETFLNAASSKKELYFSDGELVDADGVSLKSGLWESIYIKEELNKKPDMLLCLLKRPVVTGAAMLVSKGLIDQVDFIPEGWLHDEWLSIIAALNDSIEPICKTTFDYRQHGKNVVGIKKIGFWGRVAHWVALLKKLKQHRNEQSAKKQDILLFAKDKKHMPVVKDAWEFWNTLDKLESKSFFGRIKTVISLANKGWYNKFYTGTRGLLRDLISCFL